MAGDDPTSVEFGASTYHLEPQRTGRIFRKLDRIRRAFGGANDSVSVTANLREALEVFVPDLAPMWELVGYPSAKAYEAKLAHDEEVEKARDAYAISLKIEGVDKFSELTAEQAQGFEEPEWPEDPYDEAADHSPTGPEIADLIQAIYAVNGGKRLEKLVGNVVDPQMLKAIVRNLYVQWATNQAAAAASPPQPSPSSSSPNGGSASTSSGTTDPTGQDAADTDSPLADSSTDSTPEASAASAN